MSNGAEVGGWQLGTIYGLGAAELLLNLAGMPASVLNLVLICRTSLIHPNMKSILLYQSSCLLLASPPHLPRPAPFSIPLQRGVARFAVCLLKFILADPTASETMEPMRLMFQIAVYNRNFVAEVLIIERVMATVMVRTYERTRGCYFTLLWSPIVLFFWIWVYNERAYRQRLERHVHSLTERYQLSENIRIGKQLTPSLVFNFGVPGYSFLVPVTTTLATLFGLLIEVTTVTYSAVHKASAQSVPLRCHPFLLREVHSMGSRLLNRLWVRRTGRVADEADTEEGNGALATRDILTGSVLTHQTAQQYFQILRRSWEN